MIRRSNRYLYTLTLFISFRGQRREKTPPRPPKTELSIAEKTSTKNLFSNAVGRQHHGNSEIDASNVQRPTMAHDTVFFHFFLKYLPHFRQPQFDSDNSILYWQV